MCGGHRYSASKLMLGSPLGGMSGLRTLIEEGSIQLSIMHQLSISHA